jgi:hypothetical protein
MILVGGNSPVQGFTDSAKATSRVLGDQIMLWMPSAGAQDAIPGVNIVRCPNWSPNQTVNSYLADIAPIINVWSHVPGVVFQLGNEPDLEAGHMGERIREFADGVHYAAAWAKVGNPPLSVENGHSVRADHCDAVLMHSYFERQHPEDIDNPNLGASYRYGLAIAAGRPVYVTEFNVVQTNGGVDWSDRNRLVADWLYRAQADGVAGACLFILDASAEWASFDVQVGAALEILAYFGREAPPTPPVPVPDPAPAPTSGTYGRDYDPRGYKPLSPRWLPFVRAHNPAEAEVICRAYDDACRLVGYDPNAAIAQGCVETTVFMSQRWRNAHNAAGIGIYSDGTPDKIFGPAPHGDPVVGIRAQVELLSDYYLGGREPWGVLHTMGYGGMDKGFTRLRDMDGVWAADTGYSAAIVRYLADVVGGAVIEQPTFVTGDEVIAAWLPDIGKDTFIDEGVVVPSYYRCEEAVEVMEERCGLTRLRYPDANTDADAAPLSTIFPAPKGARVFFKGSGWSAYGHVGHSLGDGRTISALQVVTIRDGWQSVAMGCVGWRYAPGVGPGDPTPKYRKMRVASMGDGFAPAELQRIWFGTPKPSAAAQKNFPYEEGHGITTAFGELLNGTFNYGDQDFRGLSISPGECISKEEFDPGTPGRSVRYYANGKITALRQADGTYTFRWN